MRVTVQCGIYTAGKEGGSGPPGAMMLILPGGGDHVQSDESQ